MAAPQCGQCPDLTARSIADQFGCELTVLDEACRERGMGAYLAVAQGASIPPGSCTW